METVIEVVSLRPEHIDSLYEIYLAQVERVPHSRFTPSLTRFRDDLLGHSPTLEGLFEIATQSHIFVAEEAGIAKGFVRWAAYNNHEKVERQAIAGLFFVTEQAGEALIRACEAKTTTSELLAFPTSHGITPMYSYNGGWDGLSDHVPQVAKVLAKQGYTPYERELNLIAPLPVGQGQISALSPEISLTVPYFPVEQQVAREALAWDGDKKVAICLNSTLAFLSDDEAAARVGYVWWLHVEEEYRRRGIARSLISAAMNQMTELGCASCWLTTSGTNWNAQSLYYSLGFEVVDASSSFRKHIGSK